MVTTPQFNIHSNYIPSGDQPEAIRKITESFKAGNKHTVLLGVTGSGKTFTMANIIQNLQRPTLVLAHNKTLAAQLCSELKEFFPENAVEYFVSYYDYYQPEAYLPHTDTYIEKDMEINEEIDRLRHSATYSLFERNDVIIVASVSCIYTLGDPESYKRMTVSIRENQKVDISDIARQLIGIRYNRNDYDFVRGTFRIKGDVLEIFPAANDDKCIRIEFFDDIVERISEINPITGEILSILKHVAIYPAMHYVTEPNKMEKAINEILDELDERIEWFTKNNKLIEAQRIKERTLYDIEFLRQMGYCKGVENYSRVLSGRAPGSTPYTLLDYFPKNFITIIDESHVTVPQVRGMSGGDRARKTNLVDFGFRLPSAYDNRPLNFGEFESKMNQVLYVSATPAAYEKEKASVIAEQIIRPTGLLDPEISVRPTENQIDDLISEINMRVEKNERVIVVTLTKRLSESLSSYLKSLNIRVRYMHHDIDTLERIEILRDLRLGEFDVIVGINLLREGLDLPEVSLIAILDADKEGFLRNETSLIQIIGRAARNAEGKVIMYADSVTPSMEKAITETERRRSIQEEYNKKNGIIPKTIVKQISNPLAITISPKELRQTQKTSDSKKLTKAEREDLISRLTHEMKNAAKQLEYEYAAQLRDEINKLKKELEKLKK